jgi:hypothetical protein
MTVEAMMTETVLRRRPTGEFIQSFSGAPTAVTEDESTIMYLEPRSDRMRASEAREEGYVPIGDWLGVGLASFDFGAHDQIIWGDRMFDVVAPPRAMPNPRLGTMSHVELDLQLVGDAEDAS